MDDAERLFREELQRRGVGYSINAKGLYEIQLQGQQLTVSLDNVRRNYERDEDAGAVVRFVDQICENYLREPPTWEQAEPWIRYCLEPNDIDFSDTLIQKVTDDLTKVFAYTPEDGSYIAWINTDILEGWEKTPDEVAARAEQNMAQLVEATRLEVEPIDGHSLGMLALEETAFKAALILSPALRTLAEPELGWPLLAVAPCRDFVYLLPESSQPLLGRLGRVVVEEFQKSGHPISRDVLRLTERGPEPIGTYPLPE